MKTVHAHRAQGIGEQSVEATQIILESEMPRFESVEISRDVFKKDAEKIADALCTTLPGGTLDQLLGELLQRKASLFIVPMFKK